MSKEDLQELKKAYNVVFDENGEVKACGRECTTHLIKSIKKYTNKNVGDENTCRMDVKELKSVYEKLTAYQGALVM
jgi:hypothetical protein